MTPEYPPSLNSPTAMTGDRRMPKPVWQVNSTDGYTCRVVRYTDHLGHLTVQDPTGGAILHEEVTLPNSNLIGPATQVVWLQMCTWAIEFHHYDMEDSG